MILPELPSIPLAQITGRSLPGTTGQGTQLPGSNTKQGAVGYALLGALLLVIIFIFVVRHHHRSRWQ